MKIYARNEFNNILRGYNMLLYFAGTMVMFDPSHECIYDFWSEGILKRLPVTSGNPLFIKAAAQLRESVEKKDVKYEIMKHDFLELFAGAGNPLAPPYESVYRDSDRIIFGKSVSQVREFYRSYGWESKFKNEIPDDHIGIELLFLTLMIEKYIEIDDEVCNREMQDEIRKYLSLHILSWIPEWNRDIQEHAQTIGYKGIGTLIHACAEDIYNLMENDIKDTRRDKLTSTSI